jgi:hypothetical protein
MVYYSKKNDVVASSGVAAGTNSTLTLTGLTPGKAHTAYVTSRCYDADNTAATSTWANGNDSNSASWTTPIPIPDAPVLTTSQVSDNNLAGDTTNKLAWVAVPWATSYSVYDADTTVRLYTGTALSYNVDVNKNTTKRFYVTATNATGTGDNSNTVTIAPKYKTPVITKTDMDDFTLSAAFWFDPLETNWGTGAKARMISTGYVTSGYITTAASYRYNNHVRADKSWYLEVTTVTGLVLKSSTVVMSPNPLPELSVAYDPQKQDLTYTMSNTPASFGLDSTNSSWEVEVSNTTTFTKTYPQSGVAGVNATTYTNTKEQPTHGGKYYVRYSVIRKNADGTTNTLVSATETVTIATKMLDRMNDGSRDMPVIEYTGTTGRVDWVPLYNSGVLAYNSAYRDPSTVNFYGCSPMPVLDFDGPGSQGFICFYAGNGTLVYYPLSDSTDRIGTPKQIGVGWNMYSEVTVVQNFWGDDLPAIVAIERSTGDLQTWKTSGTGTVTTVDRDSGNGWGFNNSAHISSIQGVTDWNGYGSVGLIASATVAPYTRYYGARKVPTYTGRENIIAGVSLQSSWDATVAKLPAASQPYFPTTASKGTMSSFYISRSYGNRVIGGTVVPVVAYGPLPYYDIVTGTGAGGWDAINLNYGFPNDSSRVYPGQLRSLSQD